MTKPPATAENTKADDDAVAARLEDRLSDLTVQVERTSRWMRFMPVMAAVNLAIGAPAFIISIMVAYATFVQADATKKIQEASAWPRLEFDSAFNNADDPAWVSVSITNSGVGPALVQGFKISLDGEAKNDWPQIALEAADGVWQGGLDTAQMPAVLRPGDTVELVRVRGTTMRAAFARALRDRRLGGEICYCDVYDRCWRLQSTELDEPPPDLVSACPIYGEDQFRRRPPSSFEPATFGEDENADLRAGDEPVEERP